MGEPTRADESATPRASTIETDELPPFFSGAGDWDAGYESVVGCMVLPDPLDRLTPGLSRGVAAWAERSPRARRLFGTQALVVGVARD